MTIDTLKGPQSEKQYDNIVYHHKGGMGEVYLANDIYNNTKVAIKIIPIDKPDEEALIKEEAKIALSLSNKHIVQTHYADTTSVNGKKYFYFVMEYITGGNLRNLISLQKQNFDLQTVVSYMIQISTGLSYAHQYIIHRDIKPENILVDESGILKICDFGLAKYVDSMTRTRTFKGSGTFPYMAPEVWDYKPNTLLMDIYSVGILFYELATLQQPYIGRSEAEYRNFHLYQSLPNALSVRSDLPLKLVEMFAKMTDKRLHQRYQNLSEVLNILESISIASLSVDGLSQNPLALLAREKIEQTKSKALEAQRISDEKNDKMKAIDYSLEQLFQRIENRVNAINSQLEQDEIRLDKGKEYAHLYFLEKSISISIFSPERLLSFIEGRKKQLIDFQKQQHGMILHDVKSPHFEEDKVMTSGRLYVSGGRSIDKRWGFNVLLRKMTDDDNYGEWHVCWFDDDGFQARYGGVVEHYSLDEYDFYTAYEKGRSPAVGVSRVNLKILEDSDLDLFISKLFE